MQRKRRSRAQVTCFCEAYWFPHRIGGGACSGSSWAASYFTYERSACVGCCANCGTACQVATGQESIESCEGHREHLRSQPEERHPKTDEAIGIEIAILYEEHCAQEDQEEQYKDQVPF